MHRRDIEDRVFRLAGDTLRWARAHHTRGADRDLVRQFTRAVTSVGALLEEARGAETRADFIHKVSVARKEAFEAHYWARLLLVGVRDPELQRLQSEINQVAAIVTAIRRNARARTAGPASGRQGVKPSELR